MRFRRRDASAGDVSPVAADFAAVLDGRRLWLAVATTPGRLALRSYDGAVLDLPDDAPADDTHLTARIDLVDLPAVAASYDVVLVDAEGTTRPLSTAPLTPRRTPVAPDGRSRHGLVRTDEGMLRLETEVQPEAVVLASASVGPDGIRLGLDGPVHLVAGDGSLVATWPDGLLSATVLADLPPQQTRVLAGDLPVRRRADDLADPGRAAPLPSVGRLRLRWSPDGLLQARVVDAS